MEGRERRPTSWVRDINGGSLVSRKNGNGEGNIITDNRVVKRCRYNSGFREHMYGMSFYVGGRGSEVEVSRKRIIGKK